ncbi:bifunctional YncE family protein/alkaline phosphatase family protein [Paludisphaera mucosa]|uniref:Bifunctional YncE family protein/alkaline phosphatase family protein n=1 Tax=Paludisphaera mucosa TaxID=3030827 RepID=A0ABT6FGG1_9BACT|nr:bifunctional YncE family protein/alkaline phosphatase family protein [Paludisphaera mucosa]MDG3006654.1 bifunctional YncE family protein/alkaline phosphatase family protein [Paludisphaera mucosa]
MMQRMMRFLVGLGLAARVATVAAQGVPEKPARAEAAVWPGVRPSGSVLLPNGWSLRPAGSQTPLGDFPILLAEHPSQPVLAVLHAGYGEHEAVTLDPRTNRVIGRAAVPETYGGLAWSADGTRLFVGGGFDDVVYVFDHAEGLLSKRRTLALHGPGPAGAEDPTTPLPRARRGAEQAKGAVAGLAPSRDGSTLWVADAFAHQIVQVDLNAGKAVAEIPLPAESYPYGLTLDESRGRLYASLWGRAEVAVVDTAGRKILASWKTEEHPNEMLLTKAGRFLFVANANRNTVSVFDAEAGRPLATIGTAIHPQAPSGGTPNSLATSTDESILFVANANTNDVAVVNVADPAHSAPLGFIPAGWYPTSVRTSRDGKSLWIVNGKGTSSRANREGPAPGIPTPSIREYIGGLMRGTLSTLPIPTPKTMAAYTKAVYESCPLAAEGSATASGPKPPTGNPIPGKVGEPSPIKHCVYIIKENRTYDQVFGDMPEGNGDAKLCLFPEEVTPNHHALAREFVLLDNFYVDGEVSADGHEWTMGAYATDFVERTWPLSYRGDRRVPYPAEGKLAIAFPSGGYLWDKAREKGVSYRSYGEFVGKGDEPGAAVTTKLDALQGHFDPLYPVYDLTVPDQRRAERFLAELKEFDEKGEMPRLIVMRLPNDHTSGTRPGAPTVRAMVADNDLALGLVIEGLSRSKFWKETAVFVVEDDAQNGSDHVDAHRTVALAISPYIKRKSVDSTMYSTSSMLRTMELILGLNPMSQFDAAARPMWPAFAETPDLAPFEHRPSRIDLRETNAPDAPGAEASLKLDLDEEDKADDLVFNEIIWKAVRGADSVMPPPVRAAFVLPKPARDDDDDD